MISRYESLWRSLYQHADWLALKFIRLEMEWRQFEPERCEYTWDSPEMKILDRILTWAQSRGCDVMLQCQWINAAWLVFPEFADDPALRTYSAPANLDEFARGWVALLKGLIQERGYSCIRWINMVNEPCCTWWFLPDTPANYGKPEAHAQMMAYLAKAHRVVKQALREAGLNVLIMGPGETDLPIYASLADQPWFETSDDIDFHSYRSVFDFEDPAKQTLKGGIYRLGERIEQTIAKYSTEAHAAGKGFYLTEVGTQTYGYEGTNSSPGCFRSSLKDTELLVRGLNLGLDGFNHWSFVNRGDIDGQWQYVETWNHWPGMWLQQAKPHPTSYYTLGLATRHIPKNASILAVETAGGVVDGIRRVWATAVRHPRDGNSSLLVVNDSEDTAWTLRLSLEGTVKPLFKVCSTQGLANEGQMGYVQGGSRNGLSEVELPPFSLTIITDSPLDPDGPGAF